MGKKTEGIGGKEKKGEETEAETNEKKEKEVRECIEDLNRIDDFLS